MAKGKKLEAIVSILGNIDPSLEKAVTGAHKKLDKIGIKSAVVSAAMGAMAAKGIKSAVNMSKKLIEMGDDFHQAEKTIRVGTGQTGKALQALNEDFDKVYKSGPWEKGNIATAIADYNTKLGLTGDNLQVMTKAANRVAGLMGEDVANVVDVSSKAFKQWNIGSDEMSSKMDHVFKVSQATGDGFSDLLTNVQKFAPQLQSLGYDFDNATALIGQMDKAGVDTSTVLAGMKKSVGVFSKEGINAEEGFKKYSNAIKMANTETEAISLATEVFGARGASSMAKAIRNGTLDVEDFSKQIGNNQETIESAAGDTGTWAGKIETLKHGFELAMKPAATTMFDRLNEMMPKVQEAFAKAEPVVSSLVGILADGFSWAVSMGERALPRISSALDWVSNNTDKVKTALKILGGLYAAVFAGNTAAMIMRTAGTFKKLGSAVLTVGKFFTITSLKAKALVIQEKALLIATKAQTIATKIAGVAQKAFNLIMSMNPIGLIITGIMLLVGGFILLWNKSEKFRNFFIGMWEKIKLAFQVVVLMFKIGVSKIRAVFAKIGEAVGIVVTAIKTKFTAVVDFFKSIPEKIRNAFSSVKTFVGDIFTGIWEVIKKPINFVLGGINSFLAKINSVVDKAKKIPGVKALANKIPKLEIPLLASGGFTEGMSIAGEAGREAVISFDRKYRKENLSYWAKAGQMLGALPDEKLGLGANSYSGASYSMGPVHFAPIINVSGDVTADDIRRKIEDSFDDFCDMWMSKLKERDIDGAYILS